MQEYIGGLHSVVRLIETFPRHIVCVYVSKGCQHGVQIQALAQSHAVKFDVCERAQMDQWLPDVRHQGVAAQWSQLPSLGLEGLVERASKRAGKPLILALDRIQDPRNLGACLRSAAAFGVDGIIIPKNQSVDLTPAAIKVAVGAAALVPVVKVTNLARALRQLKASGYWVYGTSEHAQAEVASADVDHPVVWVMGNEMRGLSENVMRQCDVLFSIETSGFSTLNIATSTSLCLYQTFQKRRSLR